MRTGTIALITVTVLLAVACGRNGDREVTPDSVAVAPPGDPGAVPAAAQTVDLVPVSGAAVRARAVILPIGTQSQVTLHVEEAPPNTELTAHLVTGSCEQPGPLAADLQPMVTDAAGSGTSRIAVDIPPEIVLNGNHLVQARHAEEGEGVPVACGEIPAHPGLYGEG